MEKMDMDKLALYAYADSSHERERELWRGFLSYSIPVMMSFNVEEFDKLLFGAVVDSLDDLSLHCGDDVGVLDSMRCISVLLAKEIGVPPEFALAAFFDGELPTRTYQTNTKGVKKSLKAHEEDAIIGQWLASLSQIQDDEKFQKTVEKWKSWILSK